MSEFLAIGNMSIDDLVFADGTTRWCMPGGNAIYAALGMALWNVRPAVLALYGPDYPVREVSERVDLSRSRCVPRTLRNWGLYEDDGSRTFLFRRETRDWIAFCPDADDLGAGPIGGCHVAPLPWSRQVAIATAARQHGAGPITVDVDDRHLAEVSHKDVAAFLAAIDAFLPSRQDAQALFPDSPPLDAMRRLRNLSAATPVICLKLGAEGVILHCAGKDEIMLLPSAAVEVVDATGAGDAFCGGFLVGLARSGDPATAALMGSVSASFAVSGMGIAGFTDASPAEAQARMATLAGRLRHQPFPL
jgi:sugar/nucleoside kinase (ribokinase family)